MTGVPEAEQRPVVLVTGTGSSTGVSVFKALRASSLKPRIVATDAEPMSSGLFRADASYVLPWVRDEAAYLERLTAACVEEGVDMICFGSEVESRAMAPQREPIELATGAKVILNEAPLVDRLLDKWEMVRMLAAAGLPVPESVPGDDPEAVEAFLASHDFPYVLKGRRSSGSKEVYVVRDRVTLDRLLVSVPLPMLQEYLWPDDEEYTVGVYRSPTHGYIGQIVFRRVLGAGLTYKAQVVHDEDIERVCRDVVDHVDAWGPINLQLRKTGDGPRIFEINLRFSSSAVMRAHFGFNEPELCLREFVLGERPTPPVVRDGWALRYWDEIYLEHGDLVSGQSDHRIGSRGTKDDLF